MGRLKGLLIIRNRTNQMRGSRMSQNRAGKWARRAVWITLAAVFTFGCNPLATFSFLTNPEPIKDAQYPLEFKEGPKKGKDVVVAVFVTSAPGIGPVFAGSEVKLASEIAKKLPEMAKENKQKIVVIEPSAVNQFKIKNPTWKQGMHPSTWGKKLNADFVLDIQLEKMSLYQPGSLNTIYEGQADVNVDVYDVDAGPGEAKYNYVHVFKYPSTGVLDASTIPVTRFKQDYLERLAAEICRKHIRHKEASEIGDYK
jgi:hypothetical protein